METSVTTDLQIEVSKGISNIFDKPKVIDKFQDEETALKYINKYFKTVKVDRSTNTSSAINNGDSYISVVQRSGCVSTNLGFYKILN